MNKDVEFKLKELYGRIHKGRAVTINDMVFLAKYDKECLDKTLNRLVHSEEPKETQIVELPFVVHNQENRMYVIGRNIDEKIAAFKNFPIEDDLTIGLDREEVRLLLCDERFNERPESRESVQYSYFNSYEPQSLLNARA